MTPISHHGTRLLTAWVACASTTAWAQVDPRLTIDEGLRPIEAGSLDSSPLAGSMQLLPIDLRLPTGFDQVYRVETGHGPAFARMNGGLRAVFPRSEYGLGQSGVEAQIPAGTTWVIGDTPAWYADRFGTLATEPAGAVGPVQPGLMARRVDLSANAPNAWAVPTFAGSTAAPVQTPSLDGVRVPMTPPPSTVRADAPQPSEHVDLTGVLSPTNRSHRTIIAGEPEAVADAHATDAVEDAPGTQRSPWSDDQARGRTVALLLLKAAGSDEVRERTADEAVATVDTADE